MSENNSNKRIAKNAIALSIRTVVATIIGLYTSRVVLQALGIDDYGIFGVIGGVVGMASFLNLSMAGATSRFITFELGRGNHENLNRIFSTALLIHIILAIFVLILAESIGLWFVNNKMNFPPDRMLAVNVLYQFTILSMLVGFTQVPYSATIMAHERMNIYAYTEIANSVLKLGIVFILFTTQTHRLILYSFLTFLLSTSIALFYRFYCIKNFGETRFRLIRDKLILKNMLTFSGYDLYGNMCVVAKAQGQPILLNIFFGVVANAGASFATTVTGAVKGFTYSVLQAFSPRITKQYSAKDYDSMNATMILAIKFSLLCYGAFAIPIYIDTSSLLKLWLGQVPSYSVNFLKLIIIISFIDIITRVNNTAIHATGNIKNISFISGSIFLISPILYWIFLKFFKSGPNIVYKIDIVAIFIIVLLGLMFIHLQIRQLKVFRYIKSIIRSTIPVFATTIIMLVLLKFYPIGQNDKAWKLFIHLIIVTLSELVILGSLSLLVSFNKSERQIIFNSLGAKSKSFLRIFKGQKNY